MANLTKKQTAAARKKEAGLKKREVASSRKAAAKKEKHRVRGEAVRYLSDAAYVKEFLAELGGVKSIDLVSALEKRKEVDEFKLAELLRIEVKAVRKILYRLYEKKVVSFRKTRDEEKGWYTYIWKLEPNKIHDLMNGRKTQAVNSLRDKLERETQNQFFKCANGCMRIPFEKAFELSFVCPECGSKLDAFDNDAIVKQLKQYIEQVEKY